MPILTPEFRVSYPNVFQAKENKQSKKMEYSVMALFPKGADLSKMKAAAQEAIVKKWGSDKAKWPKNLKSPFRDQVDLAKEDENSGKMVQRPGTEAGAIFVNFKSTTRPGVVNEQVQDIIEEREFYAGCWARATVNAYAYDVNGSRGVAFGLNNIQKVRDGDSLIASRTRAEDDFAPIEGAGVSEDASANDLFG